MCGIVGIVSQKPVAQDIYDALLVLQHRGQDAAGIVVCDGSRLNLRKDNGQVSDVFHTRHMLKLTGNMGIGHVRYPTAGCSSSAEAQPFYVNAPYGITLAHNGNLTRTAEQLHVSQSALSLQIKKLEEQLGHPLFDRAGNLVGVTSFVVTGAQAINFAIAAEDFTAAMWGLAAMRAPVDAFFEAVQVNADNQVLRRNRLNLLSEIRKLCLGVADLTKVEG